MDYQIKIKDVEVRLQDSVIIVFKEENNVETEECVFNGFEMMSITPFDWEACVLVGDCKNEPLRQRIPLKSIISIVNITNA